MRINSFALFPNNPINNYIIRINSQKYQLCAMVYYSNTIPDEASMEPPNTQFRNYSNRNLPNQYNSKELILISFTIVLILNK